MILIELIAEIPITKDIAEFKHVDSDLAYYPHMLHIENRRSLLHGADYYTVMIRLTTERRYAVSFALFHRELEHLYQECDDMIVFIRLPDDRDVYVTEVDGGIAWLGG